MGHVVAFKQPAVALSQRCGLRDGSDATADLFDRRPRRAEVWSLRFAARVPWIHQQG